MRRRPAGAGGGFSRLELALSLAIIAAASAIALDRLLYVQEFAEKTLVEATVRNIGSGLTHAMAEKVIHGAEGEIAGFAGTNPVAWLARPPAGYIGELAGEQNAAAMPPGSWAFDGARRQLVYRPKLVRHLSIEGDGVALRWQIRGVAGQAGRMGGVRLVRLTPYRWFGQTWQKTDKRRGNVTSVLVDNGAI